MANKAREPKSPADGLFFIRSVAAKNGFVVNPDVGLVDGFAEGFAINYNRYGFYQCPCRDSWGGDRVLDRDIACPCAYCAADQAEYGHCYCGLFLAKTFAETGGRVRPIPERRPPERFP